MGEHTLSDIPDLVRDDQEGMLKLCRSLAGGMSHFIKTWWDNSNDQWVLARLARSTPFLSSYHHIITQVLVEIHRSVRVQEDSTVYRDPIPLRVQYCQGDSLSREVYSRCCLWVKKTRSFCSILSLKALNECLIVEKFRMEIPSSIQGIFDQEHGLSL